jgi:hypothetical protein
MSDTIKPATPPPPWTHTPGPWEADGGDTSTWWAVTLPTGGYVIADLSESSYSADQDAANARRIVACVNACEGIDDPAAALAEVREVLRVDLRNLRVAASSCAERGLPDTAEMLSMHADTLRAALARLGG